MTCEELRDHLDDWVDGGLPAPQAREAEAHLAVCPSCRRDEDELRQLLAHAAALPRSVAPSRDLWPAIAGRIEREHAWPWLSYVIVGIGRGRAAQLKSWTLSDDRAAFAEEPITFEERKIVWQ